MTVHSLLMYGVLDNLGPALRNRSSPLLPSRHILEGSVFDSSCCCVGETILLSWTIRIRTTPCFIHLHG